MEDELEWMALEEEEEERQLPDMEEELLMDQAFFHLVERRDRFHEVGGEQGFEDDPVHGEAEESPSELPGKRKLVIPDPCVTPIKSRRISEDVTANDLPVDVDMEDTAVLVGDGGGANTAGACEDHVGHSMRGDLCFPRRRAADIAGEIISITGPSGDRVYAEIDRDFSSSVALPDRKKDQLLSDPIDKMIEQLEHQHFKEICELAEKNNDPVVVSDARIDKKIDQLWVDKYAPKSFTELLSDEQINREVLTWLKQWDICVYGVKQHTTPTEVLKALQQHKQQHLSSETKTNWSGRNDKWINDRKSKTSGNDRPDQKILLLCGPPGLGKTTLAHVAAKHCGYRTVEINASDDRTASTLQTKILDALQMKTVNGDSKPNCLIIDEIDGAMGGTEGKSVVGFLVDLVNAELNNVSSKENDGNATKPRKRKTAISRLSRPIICICNDLYAPALRPLRQVARIYVFSPPSPHRIVTRLNFICKSEGYKVDTRALTALAVHTESDIRSCLNTVQFLFRNGQQLKTLDVASQIIGKKDMTSSMFDIWLETFWTRRQSRMTQKQAEFSRLHDLYANHGEYDLGMEGIFENFLHVHYHDVYLQKTLQCLDAIAESDVFARRTNSRHQFFLNVYRPSFKLAIRLLISQPVRPKLEWPKSSQRNRQVYASNIEIVKSWLSSMTPSISRAILCPNLIQDILSPLLSILAPKLRPVASNLLSQQERDDLKELIDTMISYGVRFKISKADNLAKLSGDAFMLDPPLYSFISFKEYAHSHGELSSTVQQMLNHEVELEAIRRETIKRTPESRQPNSSASAILKQSITVSKSTTVEKTTASASTSTAKTLSSKTEVVKTKTVVKKACFFDRFRNTERDSSKLESATAKRDSRPLLFKFHEGFTNAVKKPVIMRDLL